MLVDNSAEVKEQMGDLILAALEQIGALIESEAARNTRIDTGETKAGWTHQVTSTEGEGPQVTVGNPLENAVWEEFGTGEYALNGNGRKTPWVYQDRKGKWHKTTGKKPSRALYRAYNDTQEDVSRILEAALQELNEE